MSFGTCRLCRANKQLVKAHVIPKAFWDTSDQPIALFNSGPEGRPVPSRIGPYDENILCAECDNQLGMLDGHAAKYLLNFRPRPSSTPDVYLYRDADPEIVEKFVWSIAWRASVSNHILYKNVRLENLEEKLTFALSGIGAWSFKSSVVISEFDKSVPTLNPECVTIQKLKFLIIYANRFFFALKIDRGPLPAALHEFCLSKDKPIYSIRYEWEGSAHQQRIYSNLDKLSRPRFWKEQSTRLTLGTTKFRIT